MGNNRKDQLFFSALGVLSISFGLWVYLLFRGNSYISRFIEQIVPLETIRSSLSHLTSVFLSFYLPDYLWAFSLSCWIYVILIAERNKCGLCLLIVPPFGMLYELLQYINVIGGTGDIADSLLYLLAALSVNIIYFVRSMKMKKRIGVLLLVMLLGMFFVFALASGESDTDDQGNGSAAADVNLGDYTVEIKGCRLAKDYAGKAVVIVKYAFTNNADDPTAFYLTFDDAVYQNGVGLNEAYVLADSANYSSDNQTKEIKKGATLDVEIAYELNDQQTDIQVEVKELFSFEDKIVTKTFTIK